MSDHIWTKYRYEHAVCSQDLKCSEKSLGKTQNTEWKMESGEVLMTLSGGIQGAKMDLFESINRTKNVIWNHQAFANLQANWAFTAFKKAVNYSLWGLGHRPFEYFEKHFSSRILWEWLSIGNIVSKLLFFVTFLTLDGKEISGELLTGHYTSILETYWRFCTTFLYEKTQT